MTASFCHGFSIPLKRLLNGVSPLVTVFLAPVCGQSAMTTIVTRGGDESECHTIKFYRCIPSWIRNKVRCGVFFLWQTVGDDRPPNYEANLSLLTYSLYTSRLQQFQLYHTVKIPVFLTPRSLPDRRNRESHVLKTQRWPCKCIKTITLIILNRALRMESWIKPARMFKTSQ